MAERIAEIRRTTKETDITVKLNLDGTGKCSADTGVGFFDHMLDGFARHGLFDLEVKCAGDLNVDSHHTIEDTGIVLGSAIKEALGEKAGIRRYGNFMLPMDETLVLCALDLSGRPYYSSDLQFTVPKIGDMDTEMVREFFYAVSYYLRILTVKKPYVVLDLSSIRNDIRSCSRAEYGRYQYHLIE